MGEIVGAAILSHVPTIMLPEKVRLEMNQGKGDTTLIPGLKKFRTEVLDQLNADTFIIFDSHWHTTFEMVVDGRDHYEGLHTSDEMPRSLADIPYNYDGDSELAAIIEETAKGYDDVWVHVSRNENLPIHYGTVNLVHYLHRGERILSIGTAQNGEPEDFLRFGEVLREAIDKSNRRVVLLGSGGLSHKFYSLRDIRVYEAFDPKYLITPEAREIDEQIIDLLLEGKHGDVIDLMPIFRTFGPEGRFGHYLMSAGALGGKEWATKGQKYSEYEASAGTGQVHMWFPQPVKG